MKKLLRSRTYRTLAAALRPPGLDLAREAARGRLRDRLAGALGPGALGPGALGPGARALDSLVLCGSPEAIHDYLSAEHYRLFQDPLGSVELAESVYKEWAPVTMAGTPWARRRGLLMGEPALHMLALCRLTGFPVPAGFAGRPDHLVLELEFMAHLVEHHGTADQIQFLADHLDWLPDLAAAAAAREPAPFYAAVLAATGAWVEKERQMLVPATRAGQGG